MTLNDTAPCNVNQKIDRRKKRNEKLDRGNKKSGKEYKNY